MPGTDAYPIQHVAPPGYEIGPEPPQTTPSEAQVEAEDVNDTVTRFDLSPGPHPQATPAQVQAEDPNVSNLPPIDVPKYTIPAQHAVPTDPGVNDPGAGGAPSAPQTAPSDPIPVLDHNVEGPPVEDPTGTRTEAEQDPSAPATSPAVSEVPTVDSGEAGPIEAAPPIQT